MYTKRRKSIGEGKVMRTAIAKPHDNYSLSNQSQKPSLLPDPTKSPMDKEASRCTLMTTFGFKLKVFYYITNSSK
jgi:hypothetical protein